jgi:hypothetical protein
MTMVAKRCYDWSPQVGIRAKPVGNRSHSRLGVKYSALALENSNSCNLTPLPDQSTF